MRALKVVGVAVAGGLLAALADQWPDVLPAAVGGPVQVALAAAIGYLVGPPQARRMM